MLCTQLLQHIGLGVECEECFKGRTGGFGERLQDDRLCGDLLEEDERGLVVDWCGRTQTSGEDLDQRQVGSATQFIAFDPAVVCVMSAYVGFTTLAVWGKGSVVWLGVPGDEVLESQVCSTLDDVDCGFDLIKLDVVAGLLLWVEVVDGEDCCSVFCCLYEL